jgi:hypothetical protein
MLSDSKASIRQNDFTSFHFSRHQERRSSSVYEALRKRYSLSQRYRLSHRNVLQLFVVPKQEPMYHRISVRPSTRLLRGSYCPTSAFKGIGNERILHAVHDSYPGRPMEFSTWTSYNPSKVGKSGQQIITGIQAAMEYLSGLERTEEQPRRQATGRKLDGHRIVFTGVRTRH